MIKTISIREYDKLHIRPERDLERNIISTKDAMYLQNVVVDNSPVFSLRNRCLIAQQYVGVIEIPDISIEILPKIYGKVDNTKLRDVLIRILMVAHQANSIRQFKASVAAKNNSLIEIIILSFLHEIQKYIESGFHHEYQKFSKNISKVKGQIIFSQQLRHNILAPTKFYCHFSKYTENNKLNQFFKICLLQMMKMSRDIQNRRMIEDLLPAFQDISTISPDSVSGLRIEFNSINIRAREAYIYGRMFIENIHATMNAGTNQVYTMLFNMEQLYELFVYRVASIVFGNRITYQKMGNYMVSRNSDGKKFINLRPDLTLKISDNEYWIIDTKWKLLGRFAKESDVYQMNAYSTAIKNISKVILLYPRISKADHLIGHYSLNSAFGNPRPLEIELIDLMDCLSWNNFLTQFKQKFITT
ncbi:hypothetical protein JS518_14070 [Clostridiales bacterium FE2010]|nr:hypothetical protein JS518_14070 [Clostridiales bacterium FE2010]